MIVRTNDMVLEVEIDGHGFVSEDGEIDDPTFYIYNQVTDAELFEVDEEDVPFDKKLIDEEWDELTINYLASLEGERERCYGGGLL